MLVKEVGVSMRNTYALDIRPIVEVVFNANFLYGGHCVSKALRIAACVVN